MSDTPETDKLISDWYCNLTGLPNFIDIARKFERERCEANTKLQDVSSKLADALRERDEAMAVANDLASAASHCLGWHDCRLNIGEKIAATLQRWSKLKEAVK
jgi:hypothetical protein